MIELLLVIVVAAGIILFALRYFDSLHRSLQYRLINSDVNTIMQALNRYYDRQNCEPDTGRYQGNFSPDVVKDLGLTSQYLQRRPFVDSYKVGVVDSGIKTKQKIERPLYQLQVTAVLDLSAFHSTMEWLKARFKATRSSGEQLIWTKMPTLMPRAAHKNLWVMDQSRSQFKNLVSDPSLAQGVASHAYCAR